MIYRTYSETEETVSFIPASVPEFLGAQSRRSKLCSPQCNKRDDPEVVRVLLDKGKADANKRDANGETALHVVVRMCDHLPTPVEMATAVSMAKVLLAHGADPSSARVVAGEDVTSFTPLHVAAERGHYKLVELLVRRGADVNAADSAGATPLHYASRALKAKIVHALIAGGANVDVADAAGHKASDLEAVKNGKDSFAKAIREHFDRSRQIRTTALEENKKKKGKAKASLKAGGQKSEL